MYTMKRCFAVALMTFLFAGAAMADDAVFPANNVTQKVDITPANTTVKAEVVSSDEVSAVDTKVQEQQSLSNEKFKSAANNIESAQVDIREQLATHKALVDDKILEVANKKAELSKLKKEYKALQKKMNNIEKMKKILNENIN